MSLDIWSDHRGGWYARQDGETTHLVDTEALLEYLGEYEEIKYRRGITHDKDDLP